jgi:hypothetical protein
MVDHEDEDAWALVLAETTDPEVRMRLLAFRLSVVVREKEELNARVKKLELAYTMGRGIFWAAPIVGAFIAFFWFNWTWISKPWAKAP